jgi:hypothetical protein
LGNAITLRGLIFTKYHTIGEFAKAIGWSRNKASRIINGVTCLSGSDMTNQFEISDPRDFVNIFFAELYTKWTN